MHVVVYKKFFDKFVLVAFVFAVGEYPFRFGNKTEINQLQDRCLTDIVPGFFAASNGCFVNDEVKTWYSGLSPLFDIVFDVNISRFFGLSPLSTLKFFGPQPRCIFGDGDKLKGIALVVGKIFSKCRLDLLFSCRGRNLNNYFIRGINQIDTCRIFLNSIKVLQIPVEEQIE
jgi:hypothetical protein